MQLTLELSTHYILNEIITWEIHNALLSSMPSSKVVCQSPKFDTAGDVVIEGDLSIGCVSFSNWIHGLGTQPKSHCCQGLLQFLWIHHSTPIGVKTDEALSPANSQRVSVVAFTEAFISSERQTQLSHRPTIYLLASRRSRHLHAQTRQACYTKFGTWWRSPGSLNMRRGHLHGFPFRYWLCSVTSQTLEACRTSTSSLVRHSISTVLEVTTEASLLECCRWHLRSCLYLLS